jgi:hypothetical protein
VLVDQIHVAILCVVCHSECFLTAASGGGLLHVACVASLVEIGDFRHVNFVVVLLLVEAVALPHHRTHWLVVISVVVDGRFLPTLSHSRVLGLGSLVELLPCFLELRPVLTRLLQVLDSILELPLLSHKLLHFTQRILASILLQDVEPLSQVFVLLLELEHLCVLVVNLLRLLLDGSSELEVTLQHLLHHVERVNDSFCDRILGLVGSTVRLQWILLLLVACNALELVCLLLEELVYLLLVLDDSLRDYLSVLYHAILARLLLSQEAV